MANPRSYTAKRWVSDLLQERYAEHDQIVERIATSLVTTKDLQDFGNLLSQIYEVGYRKAIDDNKKQLEKLGYNVVTRDET